MSADINEFSLINLHKTRDRKHFLDKSTIPPHDPRSKTRFYDWCLPFMSDELESCRNRMRANLEFTYKQKQGYINLQ